MSTTNYIMITVLVQMLFILIELTQSGQACLPTTGLKGEKELQFLAGAYCKNLCCKFPAHPENHRADAHNAHTHAHTCAHTHKYIRLCNSGFLVCPVLFLFFWQYLLCLFIFQRLQQEQGGFVITVSELLNCVSDSVGITWGLPWSWRFYFFFKDFLKQNKNY